MKTEKQIALAAAEFAERWRGKGDEKSESQMFWTDLLQAKKYIAGLPLSQHSRRKLSTIAKIIVGNFQAFPLQFGRFFVTLQSKTYKYDDYETPIAFSFFTLFSPCLQPRGGKSKSHKARHVIYAPDKGAAGQLSVSNCIRQTKLCRHQSASKDGWGRRRWQLAYP